MAPRNASIQAFFTQSAGAKAETPSSSSLTWGDGFTPSEINRALEPISLPAWEPTTEYECFQIGNLGIGLKRVTFTGRIANLSDSSFRLPRGAKGCTKMVITDSTGAITVRLSYSRDPYHLRLGQLVTVWAANVSSGYQGNLTSTVAPLCVCVFHMREKTCYFEVDEKGDESGVCRSPFGFELNRGMQNLMRLKNLMDDGWEVDGSKVLVMVKSIGARKKIKMKGGGTRDLARVGVFDDSEEAFLSLWEKSAASANGWTPMKTVLLITGAIYDASQKRLSLTANSLVEVDPDIPGVAWLRTLSRNLWKRSHVNPDIPLHVDTETIVNNPVRVLYTLADIDEQVREAPKESFSGYLNLVVSELSFVLLYCRGMLLCSECCGVPIYANSEMGSCKHCEKQVPLRLNPQTVAALIDETGCIGAGKLIFTADAWRQLVGCQVGDIIAKGEVIKEIEKVLLFSRMTLIFYWNHELGRLAILQCMSM